MLLATSAGAPTPALPHTVLIRSTPGHRAQVPIAPPRVELWFSAGLEPAYARLSVWSAGGERVDLGDVTVGPEPTRLGVSLPPLPPATYTVRYRVLSIDGHVIESSLVFTIRAAPRGQ